MAYCTLNDVKALNSRRVDVYTSSTNPSQSQVESFCDWISADIDAVLTVCGITTPIASPSDYLRLTAAMGAAGLAESAITMNGAEGAADPRNFRWTEYKSRLEVLRANPALSGGSSANPAGGGLYAASDYTSNFTNERAEFKRGGGNW